MKNKRNEIFIDEDGERWKILEEIPCPRKLEPRKQTFKICFEVEYELELTETQKPHKHIIREKENSKLTGIEKVLNDIEDSGKEDCFQIQAITKTNVKVKQKPVIENRDNFFPSNYSMSDKDFCVLNILIVNNEIKYLTNHLKGELEYVFLKLWNEIKGNFVKNPQNINRVLTREKKRLKKRIKTISMISPDEYSKFINEIKEIVLTLQKKSLKINRTNISKKYRDGTNTYQTLSRKLKSLKLTYDELLECVNTEID